MTSRDTSRESSETSDDVSRYFAEVVETQDGLLRQVLGCFDEVLGGSGEVTGGDGGARLLIGDWVRRFSRGRRGSRRCRRGRRHSRGLSGEERSEAQNEESQPGP